MATLIAQAKLCTVSHFWLDLSVVAVPTEVEE